MKFLKYLLIILAVLVVGFFLVGLIKPEISYTNEVTVNKPLAESWAVSQDESKMKDWLQGYQKMEHVSGTPGTVGAVSDVHFVNGGEEMIIRETITAIVPNESIAMTFDSDFMVMDYIITMKPDDGKTKIETKSDVEGNGMFAKSIVAIMNGSFETQEQTNLEKLKNTIEENSSPYSSY